MCCYFGTHIKPYEKFTNDDPLLEWDVNVRDILWSGLLPIDGVCDIVLGYTNGFEGEHVAMFAGHTHPVLALAALSNGRLASGSAYTIRIWDVARGTCRPMKIIHTGFIWSLVALTDGTRECIASGSSDQTVRIWDISHGTCLQTLRGHTRLVSALAVLNGGHTPRLASGSFDCTVRVWDISDGTCLQTIVGHLSAVSALTVQTIVSHLSAVSALTVQSDGTLVTGSYDGLVRVWDVPNNECLVTFNAHTNFVSCLVALSDGTTQCIATGTGDKVCIWDVTSGECLRTFEGHSDMVCTLAVLRDGTLASGSRDNTVRVWDMLSGKCLYTLKGHTGDVNALAVLSDGKLATGSNDKAIRIWE
jgi:WD40 repeat protein